MFVEAPASNVFHGEEWDAVRAHSAAVKLRDVGMVEAGEEALFALEVANQIDLIEAAPNELERDLAPQLAIQREIDCTHPTPRDK